MIAMSLAPLAVAALAFLVERPMHPYEMFQLVLKRREDRVVKVSAGSLYRTVEKLDDLGFAEQVGVDREGNRPERTTYRITDAGREALTLAVQSMLATPALEFPEFTLALSEMHVLPRAQTVEALRMRTAELDAEIILLDRSVELVAERDLPEIYWIDLPYRRAVLAAQRDWITATVSRLEAGDIPWPSKPSPLTEHTAKEEQTA